MIGFQAVTWTKSGEQAEISTTLLLSFQPALTLSEHGGDGGGFRKCCRHISDDVCIREERVGHPPFPSVWCPMAQVIDGGAPSFNHSGPYGLAAS